MTSAEPAPSVGGPLSHVPLDVLDLTVFKYTLCLAKTFKRIQIIFMLLEAMSLAKLSEIFIQIGYFF